MTTDARLFGRLRWFIVLHFVVRFPHHAGQYQSQHGRYEAEGHRDKAEAPADVQVLKFETYLVLNDRGVQSDTGGVQDYWNRYKIQDTIF